MPERIRVTGRLADLVSPPFSETQKDLLKKKGVITFPVDALSILDLKNLGVAFWSNWHEGNLLETLKSIKGEVGVHVDHPFLTGSGKRTMLEHVARVSEYGRSLSKEVLGISAIIGEAPDYSVLEYVYHQSTNKSLFRQGVISMNAVTATLIDGNLPLFVGKHYSDNLVVSYRAGGSVYSDIEAMPLIINTGS